MHAVIHCSFSRWKGRAQTIHVDHIKKQRLSVCADVRVSPDQVAEQPQVELSQTQVKRMSLHEQLVRVTDMTFPPRC